MPRSSAARRTPSASTWLEYCSAEAASPSRVSAVNGAFGRTSISSGRPAVRVPVLSNAAERTRASCSITAPPLTMMPAFAARESPPRNATGAAISRGQGVASTSTSAKRVGLPDTAHATPAMASETAVNGMAKRSARRTTGARESWASRTRATICWYWLSWLVWVARMRMAVGPLTLPERISSPVARSAGRLSPVSDDSSNDPEGESSTPSTGTSSAGRTSNTSPMRTSSAAAS